MNRFSFQKNLYCSCKGNGLEEFKLEAIKTPIVANQNHNQVSLHASQDGCYPKVYKQ